MSGVLPGRPNCRRQALTTGYWEGRHFTAYVTGFAFTILQNPQTTVQTVYSAGDEALDSIAFDESYGIIAVASHFAVHLYRPYEAAHSTIPKWAIYSSFPLGNSPTVSLPCPVSAACVSYDSTYIASTGWGDCAVQIWRRLAFGSQETHFDLSYVVHPGEVTGIRWRKPFYPSQTIENVLYTCCADGTIRLWAAADNSGQSRLRVCAKLLDSQKGPAWAPIREISLVNLTPHSIGDSTWLADGHLVVGAGNQILTFSRQYDISSSLVSKLKLAPGKDGTWDMFDTVQRLNGPLPIFHPQFLSQCILSGKFQLVQDILATLHTALKYLSEGEILDKYLDLDLSRFYEPIAGLDNHKFGNLGSYLGASGIHTISV
ncbi:unnamed protein product [Parascedosporium putredinis]|uniref:RAVE complex protein Rav1 C-terminal domain-containing protein n=1 Tax=Parascedosporium putredinis TaxID=1442378 RepID=A0A9P1M8L3_9PEZI|nr:unnamed protein product [Parascedosporium putredinis]CAI7989170.1 unnamed protein product [Parascedosporium putredinis]